MKTGLFSAIPARTVCRAPNKPVNNFIYRLRLANLLQVEVDASVLATSESALSPERASAA